MHFFEELDDYCNKDSRGRAHVLIGDFNARLHAAQDHERDVLGPFVFGKGINYLMSLGRNQGLNRSLLSEVLKNNDLVVSNTHFQKPPLQQLSYREVGVDEFNPPYTPDRFAQLRVRSLVIGG